MSKIWFKAKRYGWGWYPATWQGWAVLAIYLVVVIASIPALDDSTGEPSVAYYVLVLLATANLIFISYRKGEKPRWRWGDKDK